MADFMFLFRGDPNIPSSPAEMQKRMEKWMSWMKDLGAKGHIPQDKRPGMPLQPSGKVVRGSQKAVTDGPYAEAKDLVGGYLIVQAKDLAEATELSKGCPLLAHDTASVEVRAAQIVTMQAVDS